MEMRWSRAEARARFGIAVTDDVVVAVGRIEPLKGLDILIRAEGPDTVAAFIAEPVMGAGGVVVPPKGYFEKIQAVLDRHDVLMIADEVIYEEELGVVTARGSVEMARDGRVERWIWFRHAG